MLHQHAAIRCRGCNAQVWALSLDGAICCANCGVTANNIEWRMIYGGTTQIPAALVNAPNVYPEPDGA